MANASKLDRKKYNTPNEFIMSTPHIKQFIALLGVHLSYRSYQLQIY